MSQLLILIYYYIDSGVQTCGLDFHFDNPDEDEEMASVDNLGDNPSDNPDDIPDDNPSDNANKDVESAQNVVRQDEPLLENSL